jgi:hypothetical protein
MYVSLTQTGTVTCYLTDPSSGQEGRPMTKPQVSLTTAKIWSWFPEGINARTDGLTDWLTDGMAVCLIDRPTDRPTDRPSLQSDSGCDQHCQNILLKYQNKAVNKLQGRNSYMYEYISGKELWEISSEELKKWTKIIRKPDGELSCI